jgi:hypothetical protein
MIAKIYAEISANIMTPTYSRYSCAKRSGQSMKIVDKILAILLIQILHIENVNCIHKFSTQ